MAFAEISASIAALRLAGGILKDAGNLELYAKLLSAQAQLIESADTERILRNRILELETALKWNATMRFERNVYWASSGDGDAEWPYCPRCWDVDRKPVRMQIDADDRDVVDCPQCKMNVDMAMKRRHGDGQGGYYRA